MSKLVQKNDDNLINTEVFVDTQQTIIKDVSEIQIVEIENKLINIWKEILQVEEINIEDNFYQLGGHSLKAIALEVSIEKEFNVEISIESIFKNLTIRELAKYIGNVNHIEHIIIEPAEESKYYPLSTAQKGVFIISQREGLSTSFNLPIIKIIKGNLDRHLLEIVFKKVIERHDSFRTSFNMIENLIVQKIHDNIDFHLEYYKVAEEELNSVIDEFIKPFNLEIAPLLRAMLLEVSGDKQLLVIDMHHIIADGTSIEILLAEIAALYEGNELEPLKLQYKDYAVWQNSIIETDYISKKENYWANKLSGELPALNLPLDFNRQSDIKYRGEAEYFTLYSDLVNKLNELAVNERTTLHTIFFTAYTLLLYKYTGQEDLIIGSISAGRNYKNLDNIIGIFINVLPIRITFNSEESCLELIKLVHESCMGAYENQDFTFDMITEKILKNVNYAKDSINSLFDTMFVYHNETVAGSMLKIGGFDCEDDGVEKYDSKMDIQIDMLIEENNKVHVKFEYNANLFMRATIEGMIAHYITILEELSDNPEKSISNIQMLSQTEKTQLVSGFNNTATDYSKYKPIHRLFEEQVDRVSNNIAVSCEETSLTYIQLNEEANRLARYLIKKGLVTESLVSLLLDRSSLVVLSMQAIWKAGGAYIPIDPTFPNDRIVGILSDSGSNILITESKYLTDELRSKYYGCIIELDNIEEELILESIENLNNEIDLNNLAYVLYTSGSTGKPKGVMIEHLGMMNHIQIMIDELNLTEETVIAQNASYCFDISVWQLATALAVGGKIVIYSNSLIINPDAFIEHIIKDNVSVLEVVPSFLTVMLDCLEIRQRDFNNLKYLIVTGEAVKPGLIHRWFSIYKTIKVVNAYGPAEASDDVTFYMIDSTNELERMYIGKPLHNICIYIVDKNMNLCPIGVCGELCVAGISVGRGYLNDPERTSKAFVEDPFIETKGIRMYKTGDLGRWHSDGNIEYLGRSDYQVKIRGFRIELGEIENTLLQYPGISEAAIVDKEDVHENKYVCAFYVSNNNVEVESIRNYLSSKLPEYMIPQQFVKLDNMPLISNGKIDRKVLKSYIVDMQIKMNHMAPDNEIEKKLEEIWCEILNLKQIGRDDNFFTLGGNSIKAIMIAFKINQVLQTDVSVSILFKTPTIREIADYMLNKDTKQVIPIEKVEQKELYISSSYQKSMYVINKLNSESTNYNISLAFVISPRLDIKKTQEVINALVKRHEALRTSFSDYDGEVYQRIHDNASIDLCYWDADESQVDNIINEFIRHFDLSKAPLCRFGIINLEKDKQILLMDLHHIISDAQSNITLIKEFFKLYNDEVLPKLTIQYKDFASWQNKLLKSESILKQEKFWLDSLSKDINVLNLPLDYERPTFQTFEGSVIELELDNMQSIKLDKVAENAGVTLYMLLFAAYKVLLAYHSCQEEIIVGTPIAGRTHPDLDNVVGMFVNTMAIKSYPQKDITFREYLKDLKQILISSYENQDYPFEVLVQKLNIPRVPNRNPLFDVAFSFYDATDNGVLSEKFDIYDYPRASRVSIFDITLYASRRDNIYLEFEYCNRLFNSKTINKFAEHYIKILDSIVDNINTKIMDIELEEPSYLDNDIGEIEFNFD